MDHADTPHRPPQRADARRNREARARRGARAVRAPSGLDAQIDEIARDAGVGVGTVYRHFPTKEDLLAGARRGALRGPRRGGREALEVEDPWEGFVEFMTYSARVMAEDRPLSEAMDQRPRDLRRGRRHRSSLLEVIGALVDARQGRAASCAHDIVAEDVPSLICGLGRAVRANDGRPAMTWERHLEIILAGLRAQGASDARRRTPSELRASPADRLRSRPEHSTPAARPPRGSSRRHARDPARHRPAAGVPEALGERDDWEDLRVYGALLLVGSRGSSTTRTSTTSPASSARSSACCATQGANISFAPADFRRFAPLLEEQAPRVMATAAAPPDDDGLVQPLAARRRHRRRAARAPAPTPTGCCRRGLADVPAHARAAARPPRTRSTSTRSTCSSRATRAPFALPDPPPTDVDRAIAEHARALHPRRRDPADRASASIPSTIVGAARRGRRRRLRRPLGDVHRPA